MSIFLHYLLSLIMKLFCTCIEIRFLFWIIVLKTVVNTKKKVSNTNIGQKSQGEFSKQVAVEFINSEIHNNGDEDEETGDKDGDWVEDADKLITGLFMILLITDKVV